MKKSLWMGLLGWVVFVILWAVVAKLELVNKYVLPSPGKTWDAFIGLASGGHLVDNIWFSVKINISGYIFRSLLAIPVGFVLGLFKPMREMFSQLVDSLRFIPI